LFIFGDFSGKYTYGRQVLFFGDFSGKYTFFNVSFGGLLAVCWQFFLPPSTVADFLPVS
jgi:hypothetical protein